MACLSWAAAQDPAPSKVEDPRKYKIDAKALPQISEWLSDTEGGIKARSEAALLEGPEALEKLADQLQKNELKDKDGRYTTPYFFEEITKEGEDIKGKSRRLYQQRILEEWKTKYPASKAAMLAQAKFFTEVTAAVIATGVGVKSMDEKWNVAANWSKKALTLLDGCGDLQDTDPAWTVCYFAAIDTLDEDRSQFQAAADRLLKNFPDCGYAFSRATLYLLRVSHGTRGEWEPWLRKQTASLPADAAAKLYARTCFELFEKHGTWTAIWYLPLDRERLLKGMDLLAADFPQSVAIASSDAVLSSLLLHDRKRALQCLKRANGKFEAIILDQRSYPFLVQSITENPWDPSKVGLPPIREYRFDDKDNFAARVAEAAKAGPRGLEELIQHLRSDEILNSDGTYLSTQFFIWFGQEVYNLKDERQRLEREKLLEEWRKEFPASPFAKLASASAAITYAWDGRGGNLGYEVARNQWAGFRKRLQIARDYLMDCKELQLTEPAWSEEAIVVIMGQNSDRKEFEEVTDELFENFPECDSAISAAIYYLRPKWAGSPGEWLPWIRQKVEKLPQDVKARTYARAFIGQAGYALERGEYKVEVFGDQKPDKELLRQGLKLLQEKYPTSLRIASGEAVIYSDIDENFEEAYQGMKRMNGVLDLRVWSADSCYESASRWVTWKKTEQINSKPAQ